MYRTREDARPQSQFVSIGTPRPLRFSHLTAGLLAYGYLLHPPSHAEAQWPGADAPKG